MRSKPENVYEVNTYDNNELQTLHRKWAIANVENGLEALGVLLVVSSYIAELLLDRPPLLQVQIISIHIHLRFK